MPKYVKKEKKGKRSLLQVQTDTLLNKRPRQLSPSPSVSSFGSSHGIGKENVKIEASAKIRQQMYELQKQLEEVEKEEVNNQNLQTETEIESDKQLFGKNYKDEDMVLLKDQVFWKRQILEMATGCSFKPSHVARRLLEGVFKKDAILRSTLTGQPPKSQGRERQMAKYECLDAKGKRAIIEFSMEYGQKRGWVKQNTIEINRALSQKIGEIKRLHNRHAR